MLERYGCNRNVTLSRASCVLCPISATPRWGLDRSYLAHKRMPHGLYRHRPCATVLALAPILARASVILRTGLQPSTLRERCRGLDAVSFGEVLPARARHAPRSRRPRPSAAVGLALHEFLHGTRASSFSVQAGTENVLCKTKDSAKIAQAYNHSPRCNLGPKEETDTCSELPVSELLYVSSPLCRPSAMDHVLCGHPRLSRQPPRRGHPISLSLLAHG